MKDTSLTIRSLGPRFNIFRDCVGTDLSARRSRPARFLVGNDALLPRTEHEPPAQSSNCTLLMRLHRQGQQLPPRTEQHLTTAVPFLVTDERLPAASRPPVRGRAIACGSDGKSSARGQARFLPRHDGEELTAAPYAIALRSAGAVSMQPLDRHFTRPAPVKGANCGMLPWAIRQLIGS